MCDGPATVPGPAGQGGALDAAARESAVALLAAADDVVDADRFRGPGPEIQALADAAWMFAMAGTAARWGPRPRRKPTLLLVAGGQR